MNRENIIRKAVKKVKEPLNDYERSLELIDKHNLPTVYGLLGSDVTHGAASHYDKNISLKHAYTPTTILKRSTQRAVLGAAFGAGYAALSGNNVTNSMLTSAGIGALAGATVGPAIAYAAGKITEKVRKKSIEKTKQTLAAIPQPVLIKGE